MSSISFYNKGDEIFCLDEKIILSITTFLGKNKNDSNLIECGLYLIHNITYNSKICEILLNYNIISYFEEIYERNLLNNDFIRKIIICLDKLIICKHDLYVKNKNIDFLCIIPAIKIIKTQLRPNLPSKILYSNVYALFLLTKFNSSDIYHKMVDYKFS